MKQLLNGLKYGLYAGFMSLMCCVAPVILFGLGVSSAVFAVSWADWFYNADGSAGAGAWVLRVLAGVILGYGIYRIYKKESCSLNTPKQRKLNLWIAAITMVIVTVGLYFALYELTTWYFDEVLIPAREVEYLTK